MDAYQLLPGEIRIGRREPPFREPTTVVRRLSAPPLLDTLAQPRNSREISPKRAVACDPAEYQQRLVRRARTKAIHLPLLAALCETAKATASPLEAGYRSSVYCAGAYVQADDVLETKFCRQRWCPNCSRLRMARMIDFYGPVISSWGSPHFVTLTRQTVVVEQLADVYKHSLGTFNRIKDAMRKDRGTPIKLVGLRKTECTYNVREDRYHLHYHLIVETGDQAERLRDRWIGSFPRELVNPGAQDVRPANERSLVELLKYATKLITKRVDGAGEYVPPFALDSIFRSLHGKRLVQPIGFKVPKEIEAMEDGFETEGGIPALSRLGETILWEWERELHDWVDHLTGDVLSGYEPTQRERDLIERAVRT